MRASLLGLAVVFSIGACSDDVDPIFQDHTQVCQRDEDCAQGWCSAGRCIEDDTPADDPDCEVDADCEPGQVCLGGVCENPDDHECEAGETPLVQVEPALVTFADVAVGSAATVPVVVRNIGSCNLYIWEVALTPETPLDLDCEGCLPATLDPVPLLPFQSMDVVVRYEPGDDDADHGELLVRSDDPLFEEVFVAIETSSTGVPAIRVDPMVLSFGYVEPGDTATLSFIVSNTGGGVALLDVAEVTQHPLTTSVYSHSPEVPPVVSLAPGELLEIAVTYAPDVAAVHNEEARVASNDPAAPVVSVALHGSSTTPPDIRVEPLLVDFGEVAVGTLANRAVTIRNLGGSDLLVTPSLDLASSTDFAFFPTVLGGIGPGGATEVSVRYVATTPAEVSGELVLASNDPDRPEVRVELLATATLVVGDDVIKIEMLYENGTSSWWDEDLRDVDLHLESPVGHDCSKEAPSPSWSGYGNPEWYGFGVTEEPERIVLADAEDDGRYRVWVTYIEDCASLPMEYLAAVLGISTEALIGGLSEGTIQVSGIGDIIASICFNHESSATTINVWVNGVVVAERTVNLGSRGDFQYVVDLQRTDGFFTVVP